MLNLRIHSIVDSSRANGPGNRAVVWVQGCTLGCDGCFNAPTHPQSAGYTISVDGLAHHLLELQHIDGVTISGGEPLQQPHALLALLETIRATSTLSIIVFTGYEREELERMPLFSRLQHLCDVVIAGRYRAEQRVAEHLTGSANKQFLFFTDCYTPMDFADIPVGEIIIDATGTIIQTGLRPIELC